MKNKSAIDLLLEQEAIDKDFLDAISLSSPTKEELDKMFENPVVLEKTADNLIASGILEDTDGNE